MKLQTKIEHPQSKAPIDYNSKLVLMGSCFSDSIATKLSSHLFEVCSNPFGIAYNPVSISKLICDAIEQRKFTEEEFFSDKGIWKHFDLHSSWTDDQLHQLSSSVNSQMDLVHKKLKEATHLFVTLGTAYIYELKSNSTIVANCHKQNADLFQKRLLSVAEIKQSLEELYSKIKDFNPDIKLIVTLSPVRHLKDGMIENNRSKAHLRIALFEFLDQNSKCEYFPSYELLMDELRDYRFYDRDLLHPNSLAIDLIWEQFTELCVDQSVIEDMKLAQMIFKANDHKAFHPESKQHQAFLKKNEERKVAFYNKYPHLKVK